MLRECALGLALTLSLVGASPALACGPYYAVPLLGSSYADPADAPSARFDAEVAAWAEGSPIDVRAVRVTTHEVDARQAAQLLPPERRSEYLDARRDGRSLLADMPAELVHYQQAIVHMRAGELHLARRQLKTLLALPPSARRQRATWAAYLLGALEETAAGRVASLQQVRALVAEGMDDSLGLGAASLRRQAEELPDDRVADALDACGHYVSAGGRLGCAQELRRSANRVLADAAQRRRAAGLPAASALVTLALTADAGWRLERGPRHDAALDWLDRMQTSPHAAPQAGRLAWIAFAAGSTERARIWLDRAAPSDSIAAWIDGKMRLKAGDLEGAAAAFERASAELAAHSACDHHHADAARAVRVELGTVYMALDRPVQAMDAFLDGADWMDAAWVGERVLTVEELQGLVDRRAPEWVHVDLDEYGQSGDLPMLLDGEDLDPQAAPALLRGLLGRRLVREGRLEEARAYLPPSARPDLEQVMQHLEGGRDPRADAAKRGGSLWRAAFTLKMRGWALSATELEPDQRVLGGWYPGSDTGAQRRERELVLPPSPAELARTAETAEDRRYHFVYTADALAREAMELMPDDHPDLPQAACITGHWMKHRDAARSWESWLILQNRVPEHPLAQALDTRVSWWQLQEDGTCALPDGSPVPAQVGCASLSPPVGLGLLWLPALLLYGARRRAAPEA